MSTLVDIAISNSPVYDIRDAEPALVEALGSREGNIRHHIADVLAHIDTAGAQQAVFDAAIAAEGNDQVELLKRVAMSAKMHVCFGKTCCSSRIKRWGLIGAASERAMASAK